MPSLNNIVVSREWAPFPAERRKGFKTEMKQKNMMKWNPLDTVIYNIEAVLNKIIEAVRESKDDEPEAEVMILAATKELRLENAELKSFRIPGYLIESEKGYFCPKCRNQIDERVKYCPECGKRVILPHQIKTDNSDTDIAVSVS